MAKRPGKTIAIYTTHEIDQQIREVARGDGRSMSDAAEALLRVGLKRFKAGGYRSVQQFLEDEGALDLDEEELAIA